MESGFVQRRRGILEHVEDGRMSLMDLAFHDILCLAADRKTGIAWTSGARLARRFSLSRQLVHKYLIRLESKGYIKRFRKARSKSTEIILIHRYLVVISSQKGKYLNASKTIDYHHPVYEPVDRAVDRAVDSAVDTGRSYPYGREVIHRDLDTKPVSKTAKRPSKTQLTENEQRRRIGKRDERENREAEVRQEAHVGQGPEVDRKQPEKASPVDREAPTGLQSDPTSPPLKSSAMSHAEIMAAAKKLAQRKSLT